MAHRDVPKEETYPDLGDRYKRVGDIKRDEGTRAQACSSIPKRWRSHADWDLLIYLDMFYQKR